MDTNGTVLQGRFIIKDKDALCKALNITNLALLKSGLQFVIPKSEVFKLFRNSFQVIRNTTGSQNDIANTSKEIPSKNKELKIRPKSWTDSSINDKSGIKYVPNEIDFDRPVVKIKRCDEANAPKLNKESNVSSIKHSSKTLKHLTTSSKNISNSSERTTSLHKRNYQPCMKRTSSESSRDFPDKSRKRPNNSVNFHRRIGTHLSVKQISYQCQSKESPPQIKIRKCGKSPHCSLPSKKNLIWEYKADQEITFRNYIPIDSNLSKDEQEEAVKLVEESKREVLKSKDKTLSQALKVSRMKKSLQSNAISTAQKGNKVRMVNNRQFTFSEKKTVKPIKRTSHKNKICGTSSKSPDTIYERNLIKQSSLIGKRRSEDSHLLKRQGHHIK